MTRSTDDMPHDPGLDELFDAVHLIDAPVATMVAEGRRLGIRLRRRRRLRIAGTALAVATLVTVATPNLWRPDEGGARATVAASPLTEPTAPASPTPTPTAADPESTVPLTREAMFTVLSRMLPSTGTAVLLPEAAPGTGPAKANWRPVDGYYEISVRYQDTRGRADVRVALSRPSAERFDCARGSDCTSLVLPTGERKLVEDADYRDGLRLLTVRRERLDGMAVTIVTGNAVMGSDGIPVGSRSTVPFSAELLWAWTGAQEWQELVPRRLTEASGRR
ncbi:hypothetical protein ACWCYY_20405 [Kitasatospora sp. NPDC001664]